MLFLVLFGIVLLFKETGWWQTLPHPIVLIWGIFRWFMRHRSSQTDTISRHILIAMLASVMILAAYRRMQSSLVGERT